MRKFLVAACLAVLFVGSGIGAQSAQADHGFGGYRSNFGAPGCQPGRGANYGYGSYYRPPAVAFVPAYGIGYSTGYRGVPGVGFGSPFNPAFGSPFNSNPFGNVGLGRSYPFGGYGYGPGLQMRIGF
jgi:hypothetical protein